MIYVGLVRLCNVFIERTGLLARGLLHFSGTASLSTTTDFSGSMAALFGLVPNFCTEGSNLEATSSVAMKDTWGPA